MAFMGVGAIWGNSCFYIVQVVEVLLPQCNDQFKSGLSWMKVHI